MKSAQSQNKQQLITQILKLQEDFEALTDRSNALQHENNYFQQQIDDLLSQIQRQEEKEEREGKEKGKEKGREGKDKIRQIIEIPQEQTIVLQPGQFVEFVGKDGNLYVQYAQEIQVIYRDPTGMHPDDVRYECAIYQLTAEQFKKQQQQIMQQQQLLQKQ